MVLHSERKRRAERDAREAEGENLWTEELSSEVRVKIAALWDQVWEILDGHRVLELARNGAQMLARQTGTRLSSVGPDMLEHCSNSDLALTLIGIMCAQLRAEGLDIYPLVEREVNFVFEGHRVAFRVVDGEVLPLGSDELHTEVVKPALGLLIGKQYERARTAYVDALRELPKGPRNAITDAGTALQETLTALGCDGNSLGSQIRSARRMGLLAAHDSTLVSGIENFLHWASADRSESGDSHKVTRAQREDAWLMIHVVGALIVRLVGGPKRAQPEAALAARVAPG